ncbi:MAG: ATP-binding protein [Blastocatellia bacterium]|nr:ATP-binding protein [Blastocatellia bacterium]
MARADLLKKLIQSHQKRDDKAFTIAAEELIQEERKKQHLVFANELERLLKNGSTGSNNRSTLVSFDPLPQDSDRHINLVEIKRSERYIEDLVLTEQIKEGIERILQEFREWEVLEANGLSPVQKILFCGPSGCGKTATAEAISSELGLPLLYVRFDSVVSSLLGETAANVRKVFDYAKRGQWVMFFDEFDAIGRSRDDATEHGEIKRVVNSFLQIMDNFGGRSLIIAATNFEQALDPAVWRRFDEVIKFDRPNDNQLKILIRKLFSSLRFNNEQVNLLAINLSGATFADCERVCFDIRKSSVLKGLRQVLKEDIEEAVARYIYRQSIIKKLPPNSTPVID